MAKKQRKKAKAASAQRPPTKKPKQTAVDAADVPADAVKPSAPSGPMLRSEGQRLLLEVPGSLAEIARGVGCKSKQTIKDWRDGTKPPGPQFRAALFAAYQIPVASWGIRPVGAVDATTSTGAVAAELSLSVATRRSAPTTMDELRALLAEIRQVKNTPNLHPTEFVKLCDSETKLLGLRARLEKDDEMLEDRIVREHPGFKRLVEVMLRALVPYPDAARVVAMALKDDVAGAA